VLSGVAFTALATYIGSNALIFLAVGLTVFVVLMLVRVQSALSGIYAAALYRYAANGDASLGFDNRVLQAAFQPKA
jgi:hypothetical protein